MENKKYKHKIRNKIATLLDNNNYYTIKNDHFPIPAWVIESGNDWEEIKERNYKILALSFMNNIYDVINGFYDDKKQIPKYCSSQKNVGGFCIEAQWELGVTIHSVIHIPTQEIFTIGDGIICENSHIDMASPILKIVLNKEDNIILFTRDFDKNGVSINKAKKIEKILTTQDGVDIYEHLQEIFIVFGPSSIYGGMYLARDFKNLNKNAIAFSKIELSREYIKNNLPKPIFITEDRKEIFKGDVYYFINSNLEKTSDIIKNNAISCSGGNTQNLYFSTEEACKNYILDNKPLFSIKDLIEIDAQSVGYKPGKYIHYLLSKKALSNKAKEKLGY